MRTRLSKLIACVSSLAIAAALPLSPLTAMAQEEGTEAQLTFSVDRQTVAPGETVTLTVEGKNIPAEGWEVLDMTIGYDAQQLTVVKELGGESDPLGWDFGPVSSTPGTIDTSAPMAQLNLDANPIIAACISRDGYTQDGQYLTLQFTVNEALAAGTQIKLAPTLKQFARVLTKLEEGVTYFDGYENVVESYSTNLTVTVQESKTLESIAVTAGPTKTTYKVGEELDLTGLVVTATYSDDSTAPVEVTPAMVTGFDNTQTGKQTLTVTYEGETATFEVTVEEDQPQPPTLESIAVTANPAKIIYQAGEELNLDGLVVTATYSDDSTAPVEVPPAMVTGFDNAKAGKQTLTVTYEEKTATFEVTVYKLGDVNLDGEVKSEDALMALQAATEKIDLEEAAALAANVNGDDGVSSSDALQILQYATQKIDSFSDATA